MEIKREKFRFNRIIKPNDIINESSLFLMSQEDIDADNNIKGYVLDEGSDMVVFQNSFEPHQNERYCYIKYHTFIGADGNTKKITVSDIIVDDNFINHDLFAHVFTILLSNEDNCYSNRIVVPNKYNERFGGRIDNVANEIADYICELFKGYTNGFCRSHIIK